MRRAAVALIAVAGVALVGFGATTLWYRLTGPAIPVPVVAPTDWEVARAVEGASRQVRVWPGSAKAWGMLGKVLRAHQMVSESNVCFVRAAQLDPRDPEWPHLLGRGYFSLRPDESERWLRRAVEAGGGPDSKMLLGELLVSRGKPDDAEALLKPLAAPPGHPRVAMALGQIALARGQLDDATELFERVAAAAPGFKSAHAMLAQVYTRQGRQADADRVLARAAGLTEEWYWPDKYQAAVTQVWTGEDARLTGADNLWSRGQKERAVKLLRESIALFPKSQRLRALLGERLLRQGAFADAEKELVEAIALDPSFSRAHFGLGYAVHQQGRLAEAVIHYRDALALQPDMTVAYYDLSQAYRQLNDRARAIASLRQVIRYDSGMAAAYRELAALLEEEGEPGEARIAREQAERLGAQNRVQPDPALP